jgi:hypothetical protein
MDDILKKAGVLENPAYTVASSFAPFFATRPGLLPLLRWVEAGRL